MYVQFLLKNVTMNTFQKMTFVLFTTMTLSCFLIII